MLTLTISHNIFLTKEERYKVAKGEQIEVIGISVPIWFLKGNTSEPAKEIFCKYIIINDGKNTPIFPTSTGFQINLPKIINNQNSEKKLLDIKDGGEESLSYREFNQVQKPILYEMIHYVQIMPYEMMINTLTM
jgi:hypothetical protein